MARGTEAYESAARLGRTLARSGLTVATGGSPGAREAANPGAYAVPYDDEMPAESLRLPAQAPKFTPSVTAWASAAFEVRAHWPRGGTFVGIPTWFYGHEPPSPFASHIAQYFAVREVFDNATPNYYESRGEPTPMVLVDRAHRTERLPAWPLLRSLARGRSMEDRIAWVDTIEEVPDALARLGA